MKYITFTVIKKFSNKYFTDNATKIGKNQLTINSNSLQEKK